MLSSTAEVMRQPWTIPTRWLNSAIALFLLPIALLLTETFFSAFSQTRAHQAFWFTEEFWFFGLGAALWTLWFCGSIWALGEPRPLRFYVFGHELTHAIWVWLMGGKVREFRVSRDGGHILTDTHNFWIALAPYFYPIYSLAVIILYGFISLFYNLGTHRLAILWVSPSQWLFLALGGNLGLPPQLYLLDDPQGPKRPQTPRHLLFPRHHLHHEYRASLRLPRRRCSGNHLGNLRRRPSKKRRGILRHGLGNRRAIGWGC